MAFKAKAKQRKDGNYDLAFGKGAIKLTAVLEKVDNKWRVQGTDAKPKLKREALEEWGEWAESTYGGDNAPATIPTRSGPPAYLPPSAHRPTTPDTLFLRESGDGQTHAVENDAERQSREFWQSPDQSERAFFAHLSTLTRPLNSQERDRAIRILEGLVGTTAKPNCSVTLTPPKKGPPLYRPPILEVETYESEHVEGSDETGDATDGSEGLGVAEGAEDDAESADVAGSGETETWDGEGADVSTEEGAG